MHCNRTQKLRQLPIHDERDRLIPEGEMRPTNITPEAAIGG